MSFYNFIKEHPDKEWTYRRLSCNPNITWDIICENPDKPWNYKNMSGNPNITWDIVGANLDKSILIFLS
jgi:hypothetical protein